MQGIISKLSIIFTLLSIALLILFISPFNPDPGPKIKDLGGTIGIGLASLILVFYLLTSLKAEKNKVTIFLLTCATFSFGIILLCNIGLVMGGIIFDYFSGDSLLGIIIIMAPAGLVFILSNILLAIYLIYKKIKYRNSNQNFPQN